MCNVLNLHLSGQQGLNIGFNLNTSQRMLLHMLKIRQYIQDRQERNRTGY